MLKRIILILFLFSLTLLHAKKELLFYVGITMVKPIDKLAREFEKKCDCKIKILQGGSQDLYDSIKLSQIGDLYLPGSVTYRNNNLKDGLILDGKFVGFNKLSMVVKKGNPKNIKPSLEELLNPKLNVVLGNEQSGSVGKATKKILEEHNLYRKAIMNTIYLASDSRNLVNAIKDGNADLILNWHATTYWSENKDYIEALYIDEKVISKAKLVLNLLKTSKYPELTKEFMEFATSKRGREIFYNYGFLSKQDLIDFDKVSF